MEMQEKSKPPVAKSNDDTFYNQNEMKEFNQD